ncbi:MAG TPA: dihydrofolate reductase family protein [Anaerovoracaceae bacterium]|nr:dihydrofolate reductase family protein [Anaerovoracaceae bacterium]
MGKVILGVTISLDGFAEDSDGSVNTLYSDLETFRETEVFKESILTTGSVVMSKKEFEMADDPDLYAHNYEYQVPIFVFTDKKPEKHPKETDELTFTFITDGVKEAVLQAKAAAGDKDVNIIGSAITTQLCLNANIADELQVDIRPIFLHAGFRPFDLIDNLSIELERIEVVELPAGRTHIRFNVIR